MSAKSTTLAVQEKDTRHQNASNSYKQHVAIDHIQGNTSPKISILSKQTRTLARIAINLVYSLPSYLHHSSKVKYSLCLVGPVLGNFGFTAFT
jgi:hypothetical protein